jgi:hypothetical protein
MKTLKRFLPILMLVGVVALTIVPAVLADGSGPQGGSNSGTNPPPPPPPPSAGLLAYLIYLICIMFGIY